MTKAQAEEILQSPKFGDALCIEAAERLRREDRIQELRARVVGKKINCGPCGGDGCEYCDKTGLMTITLELADSWDLDIIEGVWEEIREGVIPWKQAPR